MSKRKKSLLVITIVIVLLLLLVALRPAIHTSLFVIYPEANLIEEASINSGWGEIEYGSCTEEESQRIRQIFGELKLTWHGFFHTEKLGGPLCIQIGSVQVALYDQQTVAICSGFSIPMFYRVNDRELLEQLKEYTESVISK